MTVENEQVRSQMNAIWNLGKAGVETMRARGNTVRERGETLVREVGGRLQDLRDNVEGTRDDVYRNLGIVPRQDFEALTERLHAVEATLGDAAEKNRGRKEPAAPAKKAAATEE